MITLILTTEQFSIIDVALKELPDKLAQPVIHEINSQIIKQQKNDTNNDDHLNGP